MKKWLILSMLSSSLFAANSKEFLPDLILPLPVNLAVPENFIVKSAIPDREPSLSDGVIWGTKEEINDFLTKSEKGTVLVAKLSTNMAQIGENEFEGENEVTSSLEKMGMKDIQKKKLKWEDYPILSVQGKSPDGKPFCIAWIGLNHASSVLYIGGHFSSDSKTYESGLKTWENVINQTTITKI